MGVRTLIDIEQVNRLLEKYNFSFVNLEQTIDGISDTTYIGVDKHNTQYIFKIYESADKEVLRNEIVLLSSLKNLPTPRFLLSNEKIELFDAKPIALFSYLEGESIEAPSLKQVSKIGNFLGSFHNQTIGMNSINPNLYTQNQLKKMVNNIQVSSFDKFTKDDFMKRYKLIQNLKIENNCVIHGDLFPDNAKFVNDKLTGVFDFIESCIGDSIFDLSVVANSWCFNRDSTLNIEYLNTLLNAYNGVNKNKIEVKTIKEYMLFASLFYASQRFNTKYIEKRGVDVKDYKEYIVKFDNIFEEL